MSFGEKLEERLVLSTERLFQKLSLLTCQWSICRFLATFQCLWNKEQKNPPPKNRNKWDITFKGETKAYVKEFAFIYGNSMRSGYPHRSCTYPFPSMPDQKEHHLSRSQRYVKLPRSLLEIPESRKEINASVLSFMTIRL